MKMLQTVEPLAAPIRSDVPPIIDRVSSNYPLAVGDSYLGAKRANGRRIITSIDGDTITYTHPPSYQARIETTRAAFTEWAVELYLGPSSAMGFRPAAFVEASPVSVPT